MAPRHPCRDPHCAALVPRGQAYCPTHARVRERTRDQARGTSAQRGYNSTRWVKARLTFLVQYPLCGQRPGGQRPVMSQCFDAHRITAAYQVDHVVPHRGDPVLFWDVQGNWQALCQRCGIAKTWAGQ